MDLRLTRKQMMGPDFIKWLDAIKFMIESTYENQVWNLVDPPEGMNPFGRKWIYKINRRGCVHPLKGSTYRKVFSTKFKWLTAMRLDLP